VLTAAMVRFWILRNCILFLFLLLVSIFLYLGIAKFFNIGLYMVMKHLP
jgi:hypothetical protein